MNTTLRVGGEDWLRPTRIVVFGCVLRESSAVPGGCGVDPLPSRSYMRRPGRCRGQPERSRLFPPQRLLGLSAVFPVLVLISSEIGSSDLVVGVLAVGIYK